MRHKAMLIVLPLETFELSLLGNLLNADLDQDLASLTEKAYRIALRSAKGLGASWSSEITHVWTQVKKHRNLRGNWVLARKELVEFIKENRTRGLLLDGLPPIGVPSGAARATPFHPEHVVRWLVFRAVANRQLGRFVNCDYCGRWGMRKRARTSLRYCRAKCQTEAHLEAMKRSQNASPEFSALGMSGRDALRTQQISILEQKRGKRGKELPLAVRREQDILNRRAG